MIDRLRLALICSNDRDTDEISRTIAANGSSAKVVSFSQIDAALQAHRLEHFDVVFYFPTCRGLSSLNSLHQFKQSPDFTAIILAAENLSSTEITAAINDVKVDWVIDRWDNPDDIQSALREATNLVSAHTKMRGNQFSDDAIGYLGKPAAILDRTFRIAHANAAAEQLFDLRDPFMVTAVGQLVTDDNENTRTMHDELIASLHRHSKHNSPVFIRVPRASGGAPVVVVSQPVSSFLTNRFTYYLTFNDSERFMPHGAEEYKDALGITLAEARVVAELVGGSGVSEAATRLNITQGTARSYLKSIFDKLSVSKQSALVRLAILSTQ